MDSYYWKVAVSLVASLLAPVVVPFALIFTSKESRHLPRLFQWWDTPDQELPGDLNKPLIKKRYEKRGFFLTSWYWLGWRNRAYGLSRVLGLQLEEPIVVTTNGIFPSDDTEVRGTGKHTITCAGRRYWEVYGVYGTAKFGLRVRFGWKLQPLVQRPVEEWSQDKSATGSLVFHVSLRKFQN
jgi:hypothetical protein